MAFETRPTDLRAFGRALRAARQAAGEGPMTLDRLAAATGISKPYLSNIETARAPGPPSEEKLRRLARALAIDAPALLAAADWLRTPASVRKAFLSGELRGPASELPRRTDGAIDLDRLLAARGAGGAAGDAPGAPTPATGAQGARQTGTETGRPGVGANEESTHGDKMRLSQVPLINRVAAGKAGEFGDLSYPAGVADAYVAAPDLPEAPTAALFAVRVVGDSMLPEYCEGEILIVGPAGEGELRDGDDCVVRLGELENFATTFKRVFYVKDASGEAVAARLLPLNPAHNERVVNLDAITGIYPLVYRLVPGRAPAKPAKGKASEKLRN